MINGCQSLRSNVQPTCKSADRNNITFASKSGEPGTRKKEAGPVATGAIVGGMFGLAPLLFLVSKEVRMIAELFPKKVIAGSIATTAVIGAALGTVGGVIVKYAYRALNKKEN